jgi:hypothetical protein
MSRRLVLVVLLTASAFARTPVARASGSAPFEFTVQQGVAIDHDTPRDVAQRRAQAAVWREAFVRCGWTDASLPQLVGDLHLADSKTGAHGADVVLATGRVQCGKGLPDLGGRMRTADLVIVGEVTAIRPIADHAPISEHSPHWGVATIRVTNTIKGAAPATVQVYFPASTDVAWKDWPHLHVGERAIWVVQDGRGSAPGSTVPTSLDVQPEELETLIWQIWNRG